MDTGAIAIKITTDANLPIEQTEEVMEKINNLICRKGGEKLLQKEGTKVEEVMNYGVNRSDVTAQIQMMLRGVPVATFPQGNSMDYTVRVWLPQNQIDDFHTILNTLIVTPKGKIVKPYFIL